MLGLLRATDADEGNSAEVYYHLAGKRFFLQRMIRKITIILIVGGRDAALLQLDPIQGILSTKKSLDYETMHEIHAIVVATNDPHLNATEKDRLLANMSASNVLVVSVEVIDQNDHGPIFDKAVYLAGESIFLHYFQLCPLFAHGQLQLYFIFSNLQRDYIRNIGGFAPCDRSRYYRRRRLLQIAQNCLSLQGNFTF